MTRSLFGRTWKARVARGLGLLAVLGLLGLGGWALYRARRLGPPKVSAAARAGLGPVAACLSQWLPERLTCYRTALTEQVRREGVAAAMASFKALTLVDPKADREGHVFAHGIGIEGYLSTKNVAATFEACPVEFSNGCPHGVLQAYLESQSSVDSASINALCAPYRGTEQKRWQLSQCVHGMGHGIEMMNGGKLPESLVTCDLLESWWERDACYGGAFMENIMEEIQPHHPASQLTASHHHPTTFKRLDRGDLLYPCSIVQPKHHQACYLIQTSAILYFTRWDIAKTARVCGTAPEAMRPTCYKSLGRDITSKSVRDPAETKRLCDRAAPVARPWCYLGAVKALMDWDSKAEPGLAFCRLLGEGPGALLCYRGVGEQVALMLGAESARVAACGEAPRQEAVEACRYGARLPGSKPPRDDSGV